MSNAVTTTLEISTLILVLLIFWYLVKIWVSKNWWKGAEIDYRGEGTFFVWYERDYKTNPMVCPYVIDTKKECNKEECLKLIEALFKQGKGFTATFKYSAWVEVILEYYPKSENYDGTTAPGYYTVVTTFSRSGKKEIFKGSKANLMKEISYNCSKAIGPIVITQSTQSNAQEQPI